MVATNPTPRKPGPVSTPGPYAGPRDSDPLTEDELSLLLAIPALPNLPRMRPSSVSLVAPIPTRWNAKLSDVLRQRTQGRISEIGPGTTICMLVLSTALDGSIIDTNLALTGCKIVVYSGIDEAWVRERKVLLDGEMIELPESEHAYQLAVAERQRIAEPTPPWPTPRRPTPAFIVQSLGTTGIPKPLRFSLYFFTIDLKLHCENHLASARSIHLNSKTVYTHPYLMISHPYWQSFYRPFFIHLLTATPLAFAPVSNQLKFSPSVFASWVKCLDVGGIMCSTYLIREILIDSTHTQVLKDMYSVQVAGSTVDEHTSELFEKSGITLTNTFGSSEFDRSLCTSTAPYNLLHPLPGLPPPLVNPLTERRSDGSRDVELWYPAPTSPCFTHVIAYGGTPLEVEPFPGEGPHHGKPSVNSKDIFREVVTSPSNEIRYMHLGRADDRIRLRAAGEVGLNASAYEARLRAILEHLEEREGWAVDSLQVFGSGLPATSLVVQLRSPSTGELSPPGLWREVELGLISTLSRCVNMVNVEMNLTTLRVNPKKRMLVITAEGAVYGPEAETVLASNGTNTVPKLAVTHKHTLRRWANVEAFKPWLDELDYSEP